MKVTVLGKRDVSFVAEDGRQVTGTSMYIGYEKEGVDGLVAEKIFVSTAKAPKKAIVAGMDAEVDFDSKGRVVSVIVP